MSKKKLKVGVLSIYRHDEMYSNLAFTAMHEPDVVGNQISKGKKKHINTGGSRCISK